MRVNIYAEELTQEVEIIEKEVGTLKFYGIRLYLKSPQELIYTSIDDNRSAVTFWVPFTKKQGNDFDYLYSIFRELGVKTIDAKEQV
jgi:hypothetical protein